MLDVSTLAVFALALVLAAGSPGPSIAALVARVLTRGWHDVAPFVAAMWIGEVVWMTCAVAGLAAIAETFHLAFVVIKYAGVAYLVYLAWQMWRAPVSIGDDSLAPAASSAVRMFLAGLSVTLGNPKIMVFYLALLPSIINLENLSVAGWAALSAIMIVVLALIDIAYIVLASRTRLLLRSPSAMRLANRVGAAAMGSAAAVIATR